MPKVGEVDIRAMVRTNMALLLHHRRTGQFLNRYRWQLERTAPPADSAHFTGEELQVKFLPDSEEKPLSDWK